MRLTTDDIRALMAETQDRQQEFERNAPIIALRKELARIEREKKRKAKNEVGQ